MKDRLIFFIILMCFWMLPFEHFAQTSKIQTVVIDAGHGGKDAGAVGKKGKEKDVTLAVAKKTGEYIKQKYPDVKVIYTRTSDVFVELNERANIANSNNADLFISIHCNSVSNAPKTHGVETFIMGEHRNNANLDVAKRENASILYESDAQDNYDGFDPNSTEAYIAFSFLQSSFKQRSLEFAELVQNELVYKAKRGDRGVQQAGFLVLYKTAMPSILLELGFISNPTEEQYMMSAEGQDILASAIYRAFGKYKAHYEKESVELKQEVASKKNSIKNTKGVVYRVQFTTSNAPVENPEKVYKDLQDVDYYEHNGLYKYTAGCFTNETEAIKYKREITKKGYKGVFVVKFEDGIRK